MGCLQFFWGTGSVRAMEETHSHNAFTCDPHVEGCPCDPKDGTACNPYWEAGTCPTEGATEASKTSKYKASWKEFDLNTDFWTEVLVGRKIESLEWDEKGIKALVLDSGERVFLPQDSGRLCIED